MKIICIQYRIILTIAFSLNVIYAAKFSHNSSSDVLYDIETTRIRGFSDHKDKDIVFGGLFAVHDAILIDSCVSSLVKSGLERVEAFLYAIDKINRDANLLPNISLGYDIRDTCSVENVALDESLSLISTGSPFNDGVCETSVSVNQSILGIAGIIGPTISPVALPVAGLLRLFTVPQVSYAASASALSNRERYGYFFRTIPPDDHQAQAMVDVVVYFGWKLLTLVHSNDDYGEAGSEMISQLVENEEVCIDLNIGIDDDFQEKDYANVASKLLNQSTANVVIFFSSRRFVDTFMKELEKALENSDNNRHFLWIASDSWAQATDIVEKYSDILKGRMLGFAPLSGEEFFEFNSYFSDLYLDSNKRNAWFPQYFKHYYQCTESDCPRMKSLNNSDYSLTKFKVDLVIDAVYSLAHAVDDFLNDNCDLPIQWDSVSKKCQGQRREMNGTVLQQYLQSVNFTSPLGKHVITFDNVGNPESNYEITNYQLGENDEYNFIRVGTWLSSRHIRLDIKIETMEHNSSCPMTCEVGEINLAVPSSCCASCSPCLGKNFANDSYSTSKCDVCAKEEWGNNPLNGSSSCKHIYESHLGEFGLGITLGVLTFFGLVCVVIVCIAMGILWKNPMIKSSGREQMLVLLCGVTMCFLLTVVFLVEPSPAVCFFQRAGTWFCFSLMLSALLVKLIRIARIFLRSHISKPPRFIQPIYQIIFTMMLVGIQMLLVVISLVIEPPKAHKLLVLNRANTTDEPELFLRCVAPHEAMIIVQVMYCSILLLASNFLALLTIRFPENFNEVRYVAFTTFCIGLVWLAFLVTYFVTEEKYHSAIISYGIQTSAIAVLFCFYCSRILAAIWIQYNPMKVFGTSSSPYSSSTGSKGLSLQFFSEKKLSLPTPSIDYGEPKDNGSKN